MGKRQKLASNKKDGVRSRNGGGVTSELYRELLVDGRVCAVDPEACIPLTKVRGICESGVKRLMRSFVKDFSEM